MPGVPAQDWAADDDRYLDWVTAEVDAGRIEVPPKEEPPPGVTVSLGKAGDVGLEEKAARLEMKLDPDGVWQRKEEAARKHRRVEARREASGNASLSGRELAVDEALTAKNSVWAEAAALCNAGLDVSLREARTHGGQSTGGSRDLSNCASSRRYPGVTQRKRAVLGQGHAARYLHS